MIEFAESIGSGDAVAWGQGCGEPRTLVRSLVEQSSALPPFGCFVGLNHSDILQPSIAAHVGFTSYTAGGGNRALAAAGRLDIAPVHYSSLPRRLSSGPHRVDVALVLVSPPDGDGLHRLGCGEDYIAAAAANARVVIAEVNPNVPVVTSAAGFSPADFTGTVTSSEPLAYAPATRAPDAAMTAVAGRVAQLVPDRATIQIGIGALPAAILSALGGHRELGLHSGLVNDELVDLIEAGVITGTHKSVDVGRHVTTSLVGSERVLSFAASNRQLTIRGIDYVHNADRLALHSRLYAINSALEVDLTGQVNTESISGRYVGSVGGGLDFTRGAVRSPGGRSIIALPSVSPAGSTIVDRLSGPASIPRADVDIVVTEFGEAHLADATLSERRQRLLAICHPDHREAVERGSGVSRTAWRGAASPQTGRRPAE